MALSCLNLSEGGDGKDVGNMGSWWIKNFLLV